MADILLRDLPDDLVAQLRPTAISHGRTIEYEAVALVRQGIRKPLTAAERLARTRYYLAQSGGPHEPLTKEQIRGGAD